METLREMLIRLLLAGPAEADAAVRGLGEGQWSQAIALAAAWGVLPRLSQRVEAVGAGLSQNVRDELRKMSAATFARSALVARRGVRALAELRRRGIPAAAFKGLAALAVLHGGPRNRAIRDVDILVNPEDLETALAALRELGFAPDLPGDWAGYVRFARRSPGFAGNLSVALTDSAKCEVDLHWSLGFPPESELATHRMLARARTAEAFGSAIPVVSAPDGLILSAHHAVRENLAPDAVMRDLLDIAAWGALLGERGELEAALERAVGCGFGAPLLALGGIVARFDATSAAARWEAPVTPAERQAAGRLVDLFLLQAHRGPLARDVFYLVHPRSLRQIVAGLLGGGRQHRRFMRTMEAKTGGAPVRLSQRLGALLGSWRYLAPRHLLLLRTLARVKDGYRR